MTFISWLLEVMAGIMCCLTYFIDHNVAGRICGLIDVAFNFILIPMSYVLNGDVNKATILAEGWISGIRSLFNLKSTFAAENNINEENNCNPKVSSISNISKNIKELEHRYNNRKNNSLPASSDSSTVYLHPAIRRKSQLSKNNLDVVTSHNNANRKIPNRGISVGPNAGIKQDEIETIHLEEIKVHSLISPTNKCNSGHVKRAWY